MKVSKEWIEKIREMREKELAKRSDYEKAIDYLKVHAGYCETKERLLKFLRNAEVENPEAMLDRLISEKKIIYEPEACLFPYMWSGYVDSVNELRTKGFVIDSSIKVFGNKIVAQVVGTKYA